MSVGDFRMFHVHGEGFRLRGNAGFMWRGGRTGDSWDGAVLEVEGFMGEQEAGRRWQKASKVRLSREGRSAD